MSANMRRRLGFTLIEMLVVIGIILVLATLGVVFYPRLADTNNMIRASDKITQALANARTRAKRDNLPTGVRFEVDATTGYVSQMEYIQQPENFTGGIGALCNGTTNAQQTLVTFTLPNGDFRGAAPNVTNAANLVNTAIQPGDYLEVFGGGGVHLISGLTSRTAFQLALPVLNKIEPTSNFRIIRQPRLLLGEDPMTLPQNIVIDYGQTRSLYPLPLRAVATTPYYEILFSPSGSVIGKGTASDKIILWLRDLSQPSLEAPQPDAGSPVLISVQIRTGFIAVNPLGPVSDRFLYTKNPRSSGL